jgi:hypothetical protein
MKTFLILWVAIVTAGCQRDGRGINSPNASSEQGEKGLSNNINAVGSPVGPLGATSAAPRVTTTGTTADILRDTKSGQPTAPAQNGQNQ